jgi:hypothetical protein
MDLVPVCALRSALTVQGKCYVKPNLMVCEKGKNVDMEILFSGSFFLQGM